MLVSYRVEEQAVFAPIAELLEIGICSQYDSSQPWTMKLYLQPKNQSSKGMQSPCPPCIL